MIFKTHSYPNLYSLKLRALYDSNAYEGVGPSEGDTWIILNQLIKGHDVTLPVAVEKRPSAKRSRAEVVNHWKAFQFFWQIPDQTPFLTTDIITKAHGILCEGDKDAGTLRTGGAYSGTGHVYPSPATLDLETYVSQMNQLFTSKDVFEFAAEVSYRFVALHPFADGNGRLSRILLNYALKRKGFPLPICICPSHLRKHYTRALKHAVNHDRYEQLWQLVLYAAWESWKNCKSNMKWK